ncbi:mechanosensitive ion channel family protein [Portibacter marinus]|uniref:mechanosensitive ion channel family protein n=1 Tax=Portibacter marinus TaxID=2898660 RepID=UPI001F324BA3|nr:mechanosensitive ion channel [Portibacter marinus]
MESWTQVWELLSEKLNAWFDKLVLSLPNIILAIVLLIAGLFIIRMLKGKISKASTRISSKVALQRLVANMIRVALFILLLILILAVLGLSKSVTTILASAGVMGLAVGLALQDPLMNFFSGVIMSVKTSFNIGDFIESNGHIGSVQNISLRNTQIRTLTGEEVSIPNKMVLQNAVKNMSTNGTRRVDIVCGVGYSSNLRIVKEVAMKAVDPIAYKAETIARPVEFIFTGFGDSAINFQLRFWTNPDNVWQFLELKSEGIMRLKEAFDQEEINIPFPIRTIDFSNPLALNKDKV